MRNPPRPSDAVEKLHDAIFANEATAPIDEVKEALSEMGIDLPRLRRRFQSRLETLHESSIDNISAAGGTTRSARSTLAEKANDGISRVRSTTSSVTHRGWTNASVLALAGGSDPVASILAKARGLVADALDKNWTGPPYDPIALAELLHYEVIPVADVSEARTVHTGQTFRIEFNPNRSVGRVRYSLAHEIAHSLFPDCADRVRERVSHANATEDEWQLEALCNIAAAEILMPFGSFPSVSADLISAPRILALQKQFKVSTEALLIRLVQWAPLDCAAFGASRIENGRWAGRWRLDYVIGSPSWSAGNLRGMIGPEDTHFNGCITAGYSASSIEVWQNFSFRVEAVGLPPYPGASAPRAVGLLVRPDSGEAPPILREIVGNALEPQGSGGKLLAHVVTDSAAIWGGGGFAAALRRKWTNVQRDFTTWAGENGKNLELGAVRYCDAAPDIRVASMVAQHGYGPARKQRLKYSALATAVENVFRAAAAAGESLHLPRIGTGHGGADWSVIRDILRDAAAAHRVPTTVYQLPSQTVAPEQSQLGLGIGSARKS